MEWEVGIAMTVSTTVTVEADTEEEACREALDVVSYSDFDMGSATYDLEEWSYTDDPPVRGPAHPVTE